MHFTDTERSLIENSWAEYRKGDVIDQGVHMFIRIFTQRPDMKHLWSISMEHDNAEQYKKSGKFCFHVRRLFNTIGLIVDGLEYIDSMENTVQDLGRRHIKYKIQRSHFPIVADGLLYAFEKALGSKFTPEVKNAWVKLYGWLADVMQRTLPADQPAKK